jgi:NADPH:quinone reductase-like Zn-dependent oxidoreductase
MRAGEIGHLTTPADGRTPEEGVTWAADNGCFGAGYPGDDGWFAWLTRLASRADPDRCLFAVAPDVVHRVDGHVLGDAAATLTRSRPWLARIRSLGLPAALVAQDGLEELDVPWDEFDVLFIGASTEWKLSSHAIQLAADATAHGKRVHVGRVNSHRRLRWATAIGADSVDGTFLAFGPDINLRRLRRWLAREVAEPPLFGPASGG